MAGIPKTKSHQRIDRVHQLMSDGYLTYQIINICKEEWGCKDARGVERYITKVYQFLNLENKKDFNVDKIIIQYNKLALKYELMGNAKMALEYRKQRDKILGIEKQNIEITQTIVEVKRK